MIVGRSTAYSWRRSSVRNLLIGGFLAVSLFASQNPALAFHDGKDSYLNGQGVLWHAVKYKTLKPLVIRSEKEEKAAMKKADAAAGSDAKKAPAGRRVIDKEFYVMGTFHVMLRPVVTLPDEVKKAMDQCQVAVFEQTVDYTAHRRPAGGLFFLQDGRTLEMIIGSDDFDKLAKIAHDQNHLPRWFVNWLKPWAVQFFIGGVPRLREEARVGRPVLDDLLQMEAEKRNMKVRPLENTRGQLMAFSLWPEAEQIKWVHFFVTNYTPQRATAHLNQMVKLYTNRDLDGLHKLDQEYLFPANTDMEAYREFHSIFLDWRNENQVEKALKVYDELGGPIFFAVGAAHLPGENGVINLLKKRGYEIKRLY